MIVLNPARKASAMALVVLAGAALAQTTAPDAESVDPLPTQVPRLDANDPGCQPEYPRASPSLQSVEESHLILRFEADGKFASVQILRGADATPQQRVLDIAAAKALSTCPFHPGRDANGKPVGGAIELTHRWVPEPPHDGGDGHILARMRECRPGYPPAALRAGAQGVTRLAFHLDETGKVLETEIVQRSGSTREHRLLDSAAAVALATCPFQPIHDEAGKPIPGTVTLTYTWRLE